MKGFQKAKQDMLQKGSRHPVSYDEGIYLVPNMGSEE